MAMHQLDALRGQVSAAAKHGTALIADLRAISERFPVLVPSLVELTEAERWRAVARLCAIDEEMPARLRGLVEDLADVLAGLTTTDAGEAWVERRLATLRAGDTEEDDASAA
jgi:hypothetical protein